MHTVTPAHTHADRRVCTCVHDCGVVRTHICTFLHAHTYAQRHKRVHMYTHRGTNVHKHTSTHIEAHTLTHTWEIRLSYCCFLNKIQVLRSNHPTICVPRVRRPGPFPCQGDGMTTFFSAPLVRGWRWRLPGISWCRRRRREPSLIYNIVHSRRRFCRTNLVPGHADRLEGYG